MRIWLKIKRNLLLMILLLNTTFLCFLNAEQISLSSSDPIFKTSNNFIKSSQVSSVVPSIAYLKEPTQSSVSSIQQSEDVESAFEKFYNQTNPFLVDKQLSGNNITVAVLDSGINNNSWVTIQEPRYTAIPNGSKVEDDSGHGTLVGGIIKKIARNVKLISIKVTDDTGFAKAVWLEKGLELALNLNVSIIHASLGSTQLDSINTSLISEISENNIPFIVSAGNFGPYGASITSPAIFSEVISVGMAFNQTTVPLVSSSGPRPSGILGPDILAPGINIVGYNHDNNVVNESGTSFAAPFVTGAMALMKEKFSEVSTTTLKATLLDSARFINNISPIHQGNGFIDLSGMYLKLLETDEENPLFVFAPREINSFFSYFGHSINGENRTYKISLYTTLNSTFSKFDLVQTSPRPTNDTINDTIGQEFPFGINIENVGENLTKGFNILNISLYIPSNLSMAKREGNISFSFSYNGNESVKISNLSISIENRYPGGNILFFQGYDNDSFVPDGPTGGFSQLQHFLEIIYGMRSKGAIRQTNLISPSDPLFITEKISGGISDADLNGQDILVLSDIEYGISESETELIQDWVSSGHSLLILSFPSRLIGLTETLSNQTSINNLLSPYGISIEDDNTNLTRFDYGTISTTESIFEGDIEKFDYQGTSINIIPDKGSRIFATAIDKYSEESEVIAAYWEEETSKGKVVVFGGLMPFIDPGLISDPNEADNLLLIMNLFQWMIKDQQIPFDVLFTSNPTKGESTMIQLSFDNFPLDLDFINGTIVEGNGTFTQLSFQKKNNIYITSWEPLTPGKAVLWINLNVLGEVPTNGVIIVEVSDTSSPDLFFLVLIGGLILFGTIYFI
ncbi:MAG: S8 family peptidase, partial [Candidatus Hodarchaeales archaeon]